MNNYNTFVSPFIFVPEQQQQQQQIEDVSPEFNLNINMKELSEQTEVVEPQKKKRGRPPKTKQTSEGTLVLAEEEHSENLPMYQSNVPYLSTYDETTNMLRTSIGQIDMTQNEIRQDLDMIRSSKTLKKKYDYIPMLTSSLCSLISTKVTAVREINKTITDSHNLDMKRVKELNLNAAAEVDDNKAIMDMYNAFISTPSTTAAGANFIPGLSDMTLVNQSPNMNAIVTSNGDDAYNNYINNLSPIQNMMLLEGNPNIKTVVVYDPNTGNRWFDVMDLSTNTSVPNTPKPDEMFLEQTTIDVHNMIARNIDLDTTYPLVVLNQTMAEY